MSTQTQTSLFPLQEALSSRIARKSDPPSSKQAGHAITESGLRGKQHREILAAVHKYPHRTSRELASLVDGDRYVFARRLPELARAGLVTKGRIRDCEQGHRPAMTWS